MRTCKIKSENFRIDRNKKRLVSSYRSTNLIHMIICLLLNNKSKIKKPPNMKINQSEIRISIFILITIQNQIAINKKYIKMYWDRSVIVVVIFIVIDFQTNRRKEMKTTSSFSTYRWIRKIINRKRGLLIARW
jgi:hypothetical protein